MKISKSGFDAVQQEQEPRIARWETGPHYCLHLAKARLSCKVPGLPNSIGLWLLTLSE